MVSFDEIFKDRLGKDIFYLRIDKRTGEYILNAVPWVLRSHLPDLFDIAAYPFTDWHLLPLVQSHDIRSDLVSLNVTNIALLIDKSVTSNVVDDYNRAMKIVGH